MFWCVSYHLGAFGTIMLPYETRGKTGRTSAKVCATKLHWNFRTIWVHLGPFGCLKKVGGKQAELGQNFAPQSHFGMFRNERTRPTLSDPEMMFWCIWDRLVALLNSLQNGPNLCKSSCHEVASEFFAKKAPDPPH